MLLLLKFKVVLVLVLQMLLLLLLLMLLSPMLLLLACIDPRRWHSQCLLAKVERKGNLFTTFIGREDTEMCSASESAQPSQMTSPAAATKLRQQLYYKQ